MGPITQEGVMGSVSRTKNYTTVAGKISPKMIIYKSRFNCLADPINSHKIKHGKKEKLEGKKKGNLVKIRHFPR